MSREIERKWVVEAMPPGMLEGASAETLRQGYLPPEAQVRVRRVDERCVLTVKAGSGIERLEIELEVSPEDFAALWDLTPGRRLVKQRHRIPVGDHTAELDVFADELDGLVLVEVEFVDLEAAHAFEPPPWFGEEVTDDGRYANATIAVEGDPRRR